VNISTGLALSALETSVVTAVPSAAQASPPSKKMTASVGPLPIAMGTPPRPAPTAMMIAPETRLSSTVAVIRPVKYPQRGSGLARQRRSTPVSRAVTRPMAWVR